MRDVGETLKKSRVRAGISQKELAEALDLLSSQMVSNWERNLCLPPLKKLRVLRQELGISKQKLKTIMLTAYSQKIEPYL